MAGNREIPKTKEIAPDQWLTAVKTPKAKKTCLITG